MHRLAALALLPLAGCHLLIEHGPGQSGAGDEPRVVDAARLEASARDRSPSDLRAAERGLGDQRLADRTLAVDAPPDKSIKLEQGPPSDTRPPDARPPDQRPPDQRPPDARPPDKRPPDTTAAPDLVPVYPEIVWQKTFVGTADDVGLGIAQDGNGQVFVTGYTQSQLQAGGPQLANNGGEEIFVVGLDGGGGHICSRSFGSPANDRGTAVTTIGSGVYIAAALGGTATIAGAPYSAPAVLFEVGLTSCVATRAKSLSFVPAALAADGAALLVTGQKINLARFTPSGGGFIDSGATTLGASADLGTGLAVDPPRARRLLVGIFTGTVNLGGCSQSSLGSTDVFFASYNSNLACTGSSRIGAAGGDTANGIAVDSAGNHALVGETSTGLTLGALVIPAGRIFISARLANGADRWAIALGGQSASANAGYAVAYDASGNLYVAGRVGGKSVNLGGTISDALGTSDLFVASYTGSGVHRWSTHLGGAGAQAEARAIAVGPSGVAVTGSFQGTVTLAPGLPSVTSTQRDVFVLLLKP